ncbi:MAG: bifunctional diaminohydroxyphosphoribosylaminopyrimidine deaminase/5-amino-6-(5-phosphoribosylamino)uracil reductase RibD [Syntrophales bacterium]|nr:bifunctional diaminohydroxyphosphoribosylaminopyrimidine deaminase/5-amino-6-(5-phosphoribosylamino)uracil reductase RibD [Syntrophales bacterium]
MDDEFYMKRALKLARRGAGRVSPNPMVGCVIVKEGRIIGEGWHACCGEAHAEINALSNAKESVRDATFYITLEPCTHFGRTPPCVERLIAERPSRVVIGVEDPNPIVKGQGIAKLKENGIEVTVGVLAEDCRELNAPFFKFMTERIPFVTVKYAQSLDGKIATPTGHSRWISSPAALKFAHTLRKEHDAILVGKGTVLQDDPELSTRLVKGKNPCRIVLDAHLTLPFSRRLFATACEIPTLVATSHNAPSERKEKLKALGLEILEVREVQPGYLDLKDLLTLLGQRHMSSLLVEGGEEVITSFLKGDLVDRLVIIISPCIIGVGKSAVGNLGVKYVEEAKKFTIRRLLKRGTDRIFILEPKRDEK